MSGRGLALSLTPEIMNEINSDCVKAYLNNNISGEWAAAIKSLVISLFDDVAENIKKHNHKEETTHMLRNLFVQLENARKVVQNNGL